MSRPSSKRITAALLERYGQTYASETGFTVNDTPSPLYRLLCLATLLSARIRASVAVSAARDLASAGWTTPRKMADATWAERTKVLNGAGYARYDESTSRMLGESAKLLLDRWDGDLRRLRDEADRRPDQERKLLKTFKGIGDVGVDIFFREVQAVWPEVAPFADRKALDTAERLGLSDDAAALARLVPSDELPSLVSSLVRVGLDDGYQDVLDAASQ